MTYEWIATDEQVFRTMNRERYGRSVTVAFSAVDPTGRKADHSVFLAVEQARTLREWEEAATVAPAPLPR